MAKKEYTKHPCVTQERDGGLSIAKLNANLARYDNLISNGVENK